MRRREFITLLGGAATWPLSAGAQQPAMPVIGFLNPTSAGTQADRLRAFHHGLKETGHVEGENVAIEYRWAEGQYDRLPALAAELARRHVAVIVATGASVPAFAAKAATTTIPIVFTVPDDPVRLGLVASLARPDGNLTGVNFFSSELVAKRLELLRDLVPTVHRVAVLANPANAASTEASDVAAAARAMGLDIQVFNVNTGHAIDTTFATLGRERPDALFVTGGRFLYQSTCPTGPSGGATCGARSIWIARVCRERRADELRSQPAGRMATGRSLCRSHPQGRQAFGLTGRAVEQVRACHQPAGGQGAGPYRPTHAARPRRRGDRVKRRQFITLLGGAAAAWPLAARAQQSDMPVIGFLYQEASELTGHSPSKSPECRE